MEEIENREDLWGPIDIDEWEQTPYLKDRVATEEDVKAGIAVFYIDSKGVDINHTPLSIKIPSLAYHVDQETSEKTLVVVVQGEQTNEEEVVGLRYLEGGNGVCLLWELEFLEEVK